MERKHAEELLLALQDKLWGYAYSLTREKNRADDLLQETFTRALCNAQSFKSGKSKGFTAWAHVIMYHAFLNSVKKEENTHTIDLCDSPFAHKVMGHHSCDNQQLTHDIYNAIDNLPGNVSKVMHMYIVGHKYIEIAAHLQMPIGTVKTRISQARIILKEQLKDYLN